MLISELYITATWMWWSFYNVH